MLKETENVVKIEGILSEVNLEPKTFTNKNTNSQMNAIGGTITVRVNQQINGVDRELEIPVHMFAAEYTNAGAPNPAYDSMSKVIKEFTSIAAGGIDAADRIRITKGRIQMNEYYGMNGNLVSFPRITASFVQKIRKQDCKPEATFSTVFVIGSAKNEVDKDGVETGKYCITGLLPQYGGKIDVVPFTVINKGVIDAVSSYWSVGDTVKAAGKLDFSTHTETRKEEVDFGEPIEKTYTISVSDLIITSGSGTPLTGEFAIDAADVETALAARKAALEALKDKAASKPAAAPTKSANGKFKDFGF